MPKLKGSVGEGHKGKRVSVRGNRMCKGSEPSRSVVNLRNREVVA